MKSPLHWAASNGCESSVKFLLRMGSEDVDIKDNSGATPLLDAVMCNRLAVAKLLLLAGACPNAADCRGLTALHLVQLGNPDMLKLLLAAGADVYQANSWGVTACERMSINGSSCDRNLVFVAGGTTCKSLIGFWPAESILYYRKELDKARADLVRSVLKHIAPRCIQICVALQALNLPALVTLTIIDAAFEKGLYHLLSMHDKWRLITAIKHADL